MHTEFRYADAQCRLAVMHLLREQSYAIPAHQIEVDLEDVGLYRQRAGKLVSPRRVLFSFCITHFAWPILLFDRIALDAVSVPAAVLIGRDLAGIVRSVSAIINLSP